MRHRIVTAAIALACVMTSVARADEGMWTFDHFPTAKVRQAYGVTPSAAFLDHVRASSLRIAGGCSASFISPQGLVMTNHHCVVECVEQLSSHDRNFVQDGFLAKLSGEERKCPDFEIDQLTRIEDVTPAIARATAGTTGDAANRALRAAEAAAQQSCGSDPAVRCDVVSLYHGGVYDLYHYRRFADVRLAFAPEFAVAQFGGDPDNFNFPRFDFDIGVLRAYDHGKPAATPDYLRWSAHGSKPGDLVYVSGNPGQTSRELTAAQLAYERDVDLPANLVRLAEYRGILEEFQTRGAEQRREANEERFYVENSFKAEFGQQRALTDATFFGTKLAEERALRATVVARPELQASAGSAWDEIARAQTVRAELAPRYEAASGLLRYGLLADALHLVEAATERAKPNGERLRGYTDQALVELAQELEAPVPVYADLEEIRLRYALTKLREDVGTGDPFTKGVLGDSAPEDLARDLIAGTKLADPAVRKALYDGGVVAIDASTDPLIRFARKIDPDVRAIRKEYEARVDAPSRLASERIAKARFAVYGTGIDPDATFTARLSYGRVAGFTDATGTNVPPYTTIGGLFERATGAYPYALPASWTSAKAALDLTTPMNLSTTNDIIGGNSGSPLVDASGEIVGLVFDGNIFSLGGDFGYDAARNRAVSVDSRALLAGLRTVYHADRLVDEIEAARRP